MKLHHFIPDHQRLIQTIMERGSNKHSSIHGPHHWMCVATIGHRLLQHSGAGDPAVVLLFALFHDAMRVNDGEDPDHGRRGAVFADSLHGELFALAPARLRLLQEACTRHTDGKTSSDPTIGICWDSDRLNLWRANIRPSPAFLSNKVAKQQKIIEWARHVETQRHNWTEIVSLYDSLA